LALKKAKEQGRQQWKLYESSLRDRANVRATLTRDLRHVIERNQLLAVYQPQVDLLTGSITGFEALLRWKHPELGMVSPVDFVPLAEESGMILAAGEWIVRKACRELKHWQEIFPDRELHMSVNLSARQLSDPNLKPIVERALADARIEPGGLALELTESSLIAEKESARGTLEDLHRMGVGLMLDDFGTGYASLSYLSLLRFDALKIDRSFVARMDVDADSCAIIRTVMGLARELRMDVIAEGIETETQLRRLVDFGCKRGQGYYFSKPVEARDAEALIRRGFAALPAQTPEAQVA
jgi:EAL domain-containing protein (putative c-di-GMP-specific phosphodiesterase class I)